MLHLLFLFFLLCCCYYYYFYHHNYYCYYHYSYYYYCYHYFIIIITFIITFIIIIIIIYSNYLIDDDYMDSINYQYNSEIKYFTYSIQWWQFYFLYSYWYQQKNPIAWFNYDFNYHHCNYYWCRRVWLDIHVIGLRDLIKPNGQLLNIR